METDILKAKIQLEAATKDVKEAKDALKQLSIQLQTLSEIYTENQKAIQQTRKAMDQMVKTGREGGNEYKVLRSQLDQLTAYMRRAEEEAQELADQMRDMESATQGQKEASQQIADAMRREREIVDQTAQAYQEFDQNIIEANDAVKQHHTELERLNYQQEEHYVNAKSSVQATQQLTTANKRAQLEAQEFATAQGVLNQDLRAYVTAEQQVRTALQRTQIEQEESIQNTLIARDVDRTLRKEKELLGRELDQTTAELRANRQAQHNLLVKQKELAQQTTFLGVATDDLKQSLITAVAAGGVAGLVFKGMELIGDAFRRAKDAVVDFHRESVVAFGDLQEAIARTRAQVPDLVASQQELYTTTAHIARDIARGPTETAEALRKAQNLGLDYNQSVEALAEATDAAKVANASMTDTLVTSLTTVNAYGRGVYNVGQVLDQYAYLTQNSSLETQDLISGMAKIISPAAEAGVGLEEVVAAMITMNRQGDDFQEIGDLLGNTLTQLSVRGTILGTAFEDAAGVGFREFTAEGGTLVEGLQLLEQHADSLGVSISELAIGNSKFYRDTQAGRGILELTGRHTRELEQAYRGALQAQGALSEQTKEFEGTLYSANLELESARQAAYAAEGSLTQAATVGWVEFKTQFYDMLTGLSEGIAATRELNQAIAETGGGEFGLIQVREMFSDIVGEIDDAVERERLYNTLQQEAARLLRTRADITAEELERELRRIALLRSERELSEEQIAAEEELADLQRIKDAELERRRQIQQEITEEAKEEAEIAERNARVKELQANAAQKQLEREEAIKQRLKEQNDILVNAYERSKSLISQYSGIQESLSLAVEEDEITKLEEQLQKAGAAIDTYYKETLVNALVANHGFSESIIDLAVHMGLITEEAGELQKQFVGVVTETEKLANIEGFAELPIEAQAAAAERLREGLAGSAEEAFALYDPANWREGLPIGFVKAEEDFMAGVEPQIAIPDEDLERLTALEEQLMRLTGEEWVTDVSAPPEYAIGQLVALDREAVYATRDRLMKVRVEVEKVVIGGEELPQFATGGSFTVPQGYQNDNYLMAVSSGEHVTVTPPGIDAGGGNNVSINLVQNFGGGDVAPGLVQGAARDGLYEALEKANLL